MLPLLAGAGIGALLGLMKGKANERKMEEQDKLRRAAITYSPWTGMGDPGSLNLPGGMASALSGGALGAMTGGMFGGAAGGASGAATAGQAATNAAPTMLGSGQMANALGQGAAFSPALLGTAGISAPGALGAVAPAMGLSRWGSMDPTALLLASQYLER